MITLIKTLIAILLSLFSWIASGQDVTGVWNGNLMIQNVEIPVVINVNQDDNGYTATMKSPKQTDKEFPSSVTTFVDNKLTLKVDALGVTYEGTLKQEEILGTFTQNGNGAPLNFKKGDIAPVAKRSQDPIEPLPYKSVDVSFKNKIANDITLFGTLTLPKGKKNPPVVILISGSGPQNRNEELKGINHRPFLVLSDYLTRQGIAVLRYDDRGVAKSEGTFKGATSKDFATDVEAAVEFLKGREDVDVKKIGLVGHSEGGIIAPMVASRNKDVAFIVLLAGTGVTGKEVLLTQIEKGTELAGVSAGMIEVNNKFMDIVLSIVYEENDLDMMLNSASERLYAYRNTLNALLKTVYNDKKIENEMLSFAKDPWMRYFIKTDPKQFLSKVTVPTLAINGSKDAQVLPELNLSGIRSGLKKADNKDYTIQEIEGLNHLFQTAKTGAMTEYGDIEETFNPEAMKMVSDWILKRF